MTKDGTRDRGKERQTVGSAEKAKNKQRIKERKEAGR